MSESSIPSGSTQALYRGTQFVWYILSLLEVMLAFRFVLKILAANSYAGFTSFIYGFTDIFVDPFLTVFRISQPVEGSFIEWSTLLAMLVYWFIAWGLRRLFVIGKPVSAPEAAEKLSSQEEGPAK